MPATETPMAETTGRQRLVGAMRDLDEHLEQRVLDRTEELTEANAQLRREIEGHKLTEQQLLRRNRELLSLQTAIAATAASLDVQFVLDTVTWEMANLLEVDHCVIFEWEPQTDSLSVVAQHPEPAPWQKVPEQIAGLDNHRLRQRVLTERSAQQMAISHKEIDPGEWARMKEGGVAAVLFIPMVFQDRTVGLLEMRTFHHERGFTDHEIALAHLLANQAASAIENAKLYEQAQREIARRKEAEEQIKASLREKEVLLKEIHHRVKNNLQVVSSLLYLQSEIITDPVVLDMFQDSQHRVRSMALVHERLYQAQDLSRIDFSDYVWDLANHLLSSYSMSADRVKLEMEADSVALDVDTAVPCGLIINELVSNSLKHAFPAHSAPTNGTQGHADGQNVEAHKDPMARSPGKILIQLRLDAGGQLQLLVSDNGVGIPADFDMDNTESLGLLLVNSLVRQLRGTLELSTAAGTEFKIAFRLPASRGGERSAAG
jgi:two-component sensor histidine kinase